MRTNENLISFILTLGEFPCTLRLYELVGVLGGGGSGKPQEQEIVADLDKVPIRKISATVRRGSVELAR